MLMDAMAYENCFNLDDFMDEFGYDYEQSKDAEKVYKNCERQYKKLHRLFTEEEIKTAYKVMHAVMDWYDNFKLIIPKWYKGK